MNGINNYGQAMAAIDKANTASNGVGSLMNGDLGGAAQNLMRYVMLNKMLKQNGETATPQSPQQTAIQQYAAKKGLTGNTPQEMAESMLPKVQTAQGEQTLSGANSLSNLVNNSQYDGNKTGLQKFIAASGKTLNSETLGDDAMKQLKNASSVDEASGIIDKAIGAQRAEAINGVEGDLKDITASADKTKGGSGLTGKIASKLGVSGGTVKGVAAGAGALLAANALGTLLNSGKAQGQQAANAVAQNAQTDVQNQQNAYQNMVANNDLALGSLPGQSQLQTNGQQLLQNTQTNQAAQAAARQLQQIGNQTQGGILNGIAAMVPGTQAYSNTQRANALQQQLAQAGVIAPSYSPWNSGGNMNGLGSVTTAGTSI